jgi:CDP-diacylglycerol--glycerol-3-phosphate 3-phosphatidyltransferase
LLAEYCFSFLQTVATFSYKFLLTTSSDGFELVWPDTHTHPHNIQASAEKALKLHQASYLSPPPESEPKSVNPDEVLVIPVIQAGQFNIREEERCLSLLFKHLSTQERSSTFRPLIDLTSGYFALCKQYQDLILQSSLDCRIVVASPKVMRSKPLR